MRDPIHVRVLGHLLRLFPPAFRTRYGAQILAAARANARGGRPLSGGRVLGDALLTLLRAWAQVVVRRAVRVRPGRALSALSRDGVLALRDLRRHPLHGVVVVITLAVALGANVAIFSMTHALLLASLPYDEPERIMKLTSTPVDMLFAGGHPTWRVDPVLAEHPGVEAAALYYPEGAANLVMGEAASRVKVTQVSSAFFRVLGVRMLLGPGMVANGSAGADDDRAVLSYSLWRSAFGGDQGVVGRTVRLSGRSYRIVGVAPKDVDFPAGTALWASDPPVAEFFVSAYGPTVIARVRPGAAAAVRRALAGYRAAELEGAESELTSQLPEPDLVPLREVLVHQVRLPLLVLSGAAAMVLLLGCVNVAGVTLARLTARRKELSMRYALGAGRARIFGQLMAELGVVAVLAGGLSVLLARVLLPLLASLMPANTPRLEAGVHPGFAILLSAGLGTLAAALAAGLPCAIAAVRAVGRSPHPDRIRHDDVVRQRGHGVLTGAQLGMAVMLVVLASLLGRTLAKLQAVPLGYDPEGVLTFEVTLPQASYGEIPAAQAYLATATARLAALPGVRAVGAMDRLPLAESMGVGLRVARRGAPADMSVRASFRRATPDAFAALGIRFVAGHSFSKHPVGTAEIILSGALATRLFGDASPLGERVVLMGNREAVVVGVVDDVRFQGPDEEAGPAMYENLGVGPVGTFGFAVRAASRPGALASAVRRVLAEVDRRVPISRLRTANQAAMQAFAARRAVAIVASLFGVAALLLALLALYSLLAQGVALRRREFGIRLALGATGAQIEAMVVRWGLVWTAAGLSGGLLLSLAATRLVRGLLFDVAPRDSLVLAGTAVTVLAAGLAASWVPARRGSRTDPITSLHTD